MPIVIQEIVSEVVHEPGEPSVVAGPAGETEMDAMLEAVIRRATERVVEILRREWEA